MTAVDTFSEKVCPHFGCNWKWLIIDGSAPSEGIYEIAYEGHIKDVHDGKVPAWTRGYEGLFGNFFGGAS